MEAAADLMPEGSEERGDLPEAERLWNFSSCWLMSSWWQLRYFLFSSLFGEDSQFD